MNVLNIPFNVISKLKKTRREISQFNSVEKSYLLAQLFFIIGLTILPTVLPMVVKTITGETATIGIVSAISTWAIMITTFFSGNIVKLFSMRKLLIGQSFAQMILYLVITMLLFHKQLTIPLLIIALVISGIISTLSTLLNTDKAGSNRIFSTAEKKETALYIYNLFFYISMVILPFSFGVLIDYIGKHIGVESALAASYLVFCASMLTCGILYIKNVYPLKDIITYVGNKRFISRKNILFKTHRNMWDATRIVWHNNALRMLAVC